MFNEWVIPDFEQAFGTSSLHHNLCKSTFIQAESEKIQIYRALSCGGAEELSFHFEPLISVQACNNLHRVFGRWLLISGKVSLGHIRLI